MPNLNTDTVPVVVQDLHRHAFDDCDGIPPETHIAVQAAGTIMDLRAEILRLVDALEYAHSNGFEWPVDPLPFDSIAHNLFIERGNDPDRIATRAAIRKATSNEQG